MDIHGTTKINEVVYQSNGPTRHFMYKGMSLSRDKILHYRMTFPELSRAPLSQIIEKHKQLIQEKLLIYGPNLEKRIKIAGYYNF